MIILIIVASQATGQYSIDKVCVGSVRYYRTDGEVGSTYTWILTKPMGIDSTLLSNADTVAITWNVVPGIYKLSVIQHSVAHCDGIKEIGQIEVYNQPLASAGNPMFICAKIPYPISSSTASNYSSLFWQTSGSGLISLDTILHPTYTPSDSDLLAGTVTLTLTAQGLGNGTSCNPAVSTVILTHPPITTASAGPDDASCGNNNYLISGATAANYDSLVWIQNGTGHLVNPYVVNPIYVPGLNETGTITFILKTYQLIHCVDSASDQMVLTIHPFPTGTFVLLTKDTVCGQDTVRLRLDLTGTPPWTFTYTDGYTPVIVTNLFPSPYYITTFPDTTVNYSLLSLSDTHCSALPGNLHSIVRVIVHPKPHVEYTWQNGPQNNEVQFHIDSSITNLGAVGYMVIWNFGDGTFGYGHNPIHFYSGSTTFNCILTVTDTNGCQNSVRHSIFIPAIPIAFYSSTSPVCLGNTMCFYDLSTAPSAPSEFIQTWIWNFGDGTPADTIQFPNNPNVCHLYGGIGNYLVSLTVRDNLGVSNTYTHNQIVLPVPSALYTYSTNCENQPIQFTDASNNNGGGNIISWSWNFGDPISGIYNISTLQNPSHIFTPGQYIYNVSLIIQNLNGCRDTVIKQVSIRPKPPVDFMHDSACNGQVVHYIADQVVIHVDSIVTWLWNFGDGSQPVTNPITATHTYTSPGTYMTTLTVTDHHGCSNSISHGVKVNPLPTAIFSWSNPVCFGNPVLYTDNSTVPSGYSGYIAKWLWDFGDGTSQQITLPGTPNVTHTFLGTALTHIVRLTVWTGDSCSNFVEHIVTSIPSPNADFSFSTVRCKNQPVHFTDLSNTNGGGSISQWNWSFDDPGSGINNNSNLQNPSHIYHTPGTYHVTLIISNLTGCSDSLVKTVDVNMSPVADFHADNACLHTLTQFTDSSRSNGGLIISYSWDFGDGSALSYMQNPTHTYAMSGIFNVHLIVVNSNGCTSDTIKPVIVNPLPIAEFSYSSPSCFGAVVQYTNLSTTPSGYLGSIMKWVWNFGDGTSITIFAPANPDVSHTFIGSALSHMVRLTVTTSDSCTSFIEHTIISIPSPVADFNTQGTSCANQSVHFTDHSQTNSGGSVVSWHWNFGDPVSGFNNTSTLQNPVHLFTTAGVYNVSLIIFNASNCTDTVMKTITISPLPLANFTADTVCLNQATQFSDLSTSVPPGIIAYSWDFGDGTPHSNLKNPSHTYLSYGIENVTLSVTNVNGCIGEITRQVFVRPLPLAEFTFSTENCHGFPVQFTNGSSTVPGYFEPIIQWVWNFGDGSSPITILSPTNPNISHVFAGNANAYTVRLTVTTLDGCSALIEHVVNVNASPIANFVYPSANCIQQSVQFTDNSQINGGGTILHWNWTFGDPVSGIYNNSTLQNPTHAFSAPGVYTVREIISNESNCSDTSIHTITIDPLPLADFIADTVCLGTPTTFTDQSSPTGIITQHFWEFGDGTTSQLTNPVHTYLADGIYQVRLTVTTQDGCSKEITKSVVVTAKPFASFSATSPTCLGNLVQFSDNSFSMYGSIHSWVWDFGDGLSATIIEPASPNINHLYTNSGIYNVTLSITTRSGCITSTTNSVTITPAPIANYIYSSARCVMSPVQFTDQSQVNGGSVITQWLWDFNDPGSGSFNSSTIPNPVHSFSASGSYEIVLKVTSANGCLDSITKTVVISAKPIAQFSADTSCSRSATQFIDHSIPNAPGISSWNWNFGDPGSGPNNFSTLQNPSHIFTNSGSYIVHLTVINSNNCEKDTLMLIPVAPAPIAMFGFTSSCVKTATQFTDLSTAPNSQLSSWFWDFGDGIGTSTVQNPTYTFTTSGTYNVKLRVTNIRGCADSIIIPVVSYPLPIASYNYKSFFCPAGQVTFTDQSHGIGSGISEHLWIFKPGSTSTQADPTFIFPITDTTYLVTLIVTDSRGCKDTIIDSVYVKPEFAATFKNDTVCFGHPTHFHALDMTKGDSLYFPQWNFGDPTSGADNTSTLYNPNHIFSSPNTFVVRLKVWDSDNCVDSIYKTVFVRSLPKPDYSFVSPPCDTITHFTDLSSTGTGTISSWIWNFGDGSPMQIIQAPGPGNITHVFDLPGIYRVGLTVTNTFGCSDTMSQLVTRPSCISAIFDQSSPVACVNSPVIFTDNSLPINQINSWHWYLGDGFDTAYTHYSHSFRHVFTSSGTFQVKLVIKTSVSGQTFTDSTTRMVTISLSPETQFSANSACINQNNLFKDLTNTFGAEITTRKWNFGDPQSGANNISALPDPSHKYRSVGEYNVSLLVINEFGCKDSIMKPTKVFALPNARFINTLACSNNPTYFFDRSIAIDTTIEKWHWDFGVSKTLKDTSQLKDPVYKYNKEGNYDVFLIVKDINGCSDTVDSTITVHPTPISAFIVMDNISNMTGKIQLRNKSEGADTYFWDFGNGYTTTDENPIVTYKEDGTYTIMLISSNNFGCADTTFYKYDVLFRGLYVPNAFAPSSSFTGVNLFKPVGMNLKSYKCDVFDSWGHLLWESTTIDNEGRPVEGWDGRTRDGAPCQSGTYIWKIQAVFIDGTIWEGSDIGKGDYKTMGTVTLIR